MKIGEGYSQAVGRNIKRKRLEAGLTQQLLAEKIAEVTGKGHFSSSTVRDYELGRRNPKPETLTKFAVALGCKVTDLDNFCPLEAAEIPIYYDQDGNEHIEKSDKNDLEIAKQEWLYNMGAFFDCLNEAGRNAALSLVEGATQIPRFQKSNSEADD